MENRFRVKLILGVNLLSQKAQYEKEHINMAERLPCMDRIEEQEIRP